MRASSAGSGFSIEVSFDDVEVEVEGPRAPGRARWPLLLCAFFATAAATAAIIESPLGQDERVRPSIEAACTAISEGCQRVSLRLHP